MDIFETYNDILNEEFKDNTLYGYHVTGKGVLDSIIDSGLQIGTRQMQGKGLYAFYDYNHAFQYATKDITNGSNRIIIRFKIQRLNRLLYLNMDIAKAVLGEKYHLINQIENYFGSLANFIEKVKLVKRDMSDDEIIGFIDKLETDNSEGIQRTLVFSMLPSYINDNLNIVWDGNYGLEFRINNLDLVEIDGYYTLSLVNNTRIVTSDLMPISRKSEIDKIPRTPEFEDLIEYANNSRIETLAGLKHVIQDKLYAVRNNREYDFYNNLLELIDKLRNQG